MRFTTAVAAAIGFVASAAAPARTPPSATAIAAKPGVETATAVAAVPEGWRVDRAGPVARVVAPEGDAAITIVDVGPAADAAAALAAAWARVEPGFARKVRVATPGAPRDGWEESATTLYETSPDEKLVLAATAFRRDWTWTVLIARGSEATFNKREGQVSTVLQTVRPLGYVPEDFAGKPARPMDAALRGEMKAFWRDAMTRFGVPGLAYAFFDRNGIAEEGGLGVRAVGKPAPIDAHTRFMIASNTKGMTTLLLARLVDAGRLQWDELVVKADPAFRLGDPATLQAIRVRHLICACTGMPRQDMEWIMTGTNDTPPARVFALLAPMKPTSRFGEVYQYSNLLASAAGYIAGRVAHPGMEVGAAYDRAMQDLVFDPLAMRDTTFSKAAALAADHADPHDLDRAGKVALGTVDKSDSIYFARPAGGAWSSAHDLALYALDELREGALPDGQRLVSREALLARRDQGMQVGDAKFYGMGLETSRKSGVTVVSHGGAMPGYHTNWYVLPDAGVGFVVLMNSETARAVEDPSQRRFVELLYGAKPEAAARIAAGAAQLRADYADQFAHATTPPDPAQVAKLARRYESPELGHIDVTRGAGGALSFDFGSFSSAMATRRNEDGTTSFVMVDPTIAGWPLVARPDGDALALVMRDAQHEYVYRPVP